MKKITVYKMNKISKNVCCWFFVKCIKFGSTKPYRTDYTPESLSITRFIDISYKTHNKKLYGMGNKTYLKPNSSRNIQ